MTDQSATARLRSSLPTAETTSAALSLWVLTATGVAAPAAALAAGPRAPTTAAGATQVLLVALAPVALLYVPYAVGEVRTATGSDRAAVAVAAAAVAAALAVVWGGVLALAGGPFGDSSLGGAPEATVPALALVLPAFGVWLHRRGRRVADAEAWLAAVLPAREDLRDPAELLADRRKATNAALVAAHAAVLAAAANLAWRLAVLGSVAALVLAAALAYGGWYVGQALVIRAGLWQPWRGL